MSKKPLITVPLLDLGTQYQSIENCGNEDRLSLAYFENGCSFFRLPLHLHDSPGYDENSQAAIPALDNVLTGQQELTSDAVFRGGNGVRLFEEVQTALEESGLLPGIQDIDQRLDILIFVG